MALAGLVAATHGPLALVDISIRSDSEGCGVPVQTPWVTVMMSPAFGEVSDNAGAVVLTGLLASALAVIAADGRLVTALEP